MKHKYFPLLLVGFFYCQPLSAQIILNGSFENTTADTCDYNLIDADFNKKMKDVTAFGKAFTAFNGFAGEIDLHTQNCIVTPQHGDWCIGMSSGNQSPTDADAIAFKLSAPLQTGVQYRLSFYTFGNSNPTREIEVGYSAVDTAFGSPAGSVLPAAQTWQVAEVIFKPSLPALFLTVRIKPGANGWTQVDNFSIEPLTETKETNRDNLLGIFPNPFRDFLFVESQHGIETVQVYDMLGRLVVFLEVSDRRSSPINDVAGNSASVSSPFSASHKTGLNLSMLPAGAYVVVVNTRQGIFSRKVLKL